MKIRCARERYEKKITNVRKNERKQKRLKESKRMKLKEEKKVT